MTDVVIFGTGRAAETVGIYLAHHSDLRVVGYTVDAAFRTGDHHHGRPLVDWENLEEHFAPSEVLLFGPFSYARMNQLRRDRYLEGKSRGYSFASFIHPSSHVYAEDIGENCLILDACVVQPRAWIGANVIIWSMCVIAHHVRIGDHCFLSGQVGVGGGTTIEPECYLSGQVGVGHGLTIGTGCALLNAVFVTRDLPNHTVAQGPGGRLRRFPSQRLQRLV